MADTLKTLENLVKLAKKNVEDLQKQIAETVAAIAHLSQQIQTLENTIDREAKAAGLEPFLLATFDKFKQKTEKDIKKHHAQRQELMHHEAALRNQLAEEFATQKRYEILLERKMLEKRKRIEKSQQTQLDEIAATTHQQKQ